MFRPLACLLAAVCLVAPSFADDEKESKIDPDLLIGKWKSSKGLPDGTTLFFEFTKDGKYKATVKVGVENIHQDGEYTLDDAELVTVVKVAKEEAKDTLIVVKLTAKELHLKHEKDVIEFVREKGDKDEKDDKDDKDDKNSMIDPDQLIGKWNLVKADPPLAEGKTIVIEFTKKGDFLFHFLIDGNRYEKKGVYTLTDDTMESVFVEDGKDDKALWTIVKLTDTELHIKNDRGNVEELTRVKGGKGK